jgi:hypothetical protein
MNFEVIMRKPALSLLFLFIAAASFPQTIVPASPVLPPGLASRQPPNQSSKSWFSVYGRCRNAIRFQNVRDQLDFCKQAVDLALQAGDKTPPDQIALLQSYESYGQALLIVGRGPDALAAENNAVDVAKAHLPDSSQEYAMPFYWRALVESHFHDGTRASSDLGTAEDTYRKAMTASPRMKPIYTQYLVRILRQHAALLDAMGKQSDADKLRDQAAKL